MASDSMAEQVVQRLTDRHNVLISGPPGTGKSRLLSEVAALFATPAAKSGPMISPSAKVPFPANTPGKGRVVPSPARSNRRVFSTVFHQNTKHRDFVTGLVPSAGPAGSGLTFHVQRGTLYEAAEHALTAQGASLLIIDEINRGPAVQIFGGVLVAMESDKRLGPGGELRPTSQAFDVLKPDGSYGPFYLPDHLYIVAAMNQADTSVEPLDVAFLRRWCPYALTPDVEVLKRHFAVANAYVAAAPTTAADVYATAIAAWSALNRRIAIGRGPEFRIGHGALIGGTPPPTPKEALDHIRPGWDVVRAHVDEVFFGDLRGIAAALNVGNAIHPLKLQTHMFADQPRLELTGAIDTGAALFDLLRAIGS